MDCYEITNIVISAVSLVATTLLTVFIILQSSKLSKRQDDLQKRQILIDERPYIEKICSVIFDLSKFLNPMEFTLADNPLDSKLRIDLIYMWLKDDDGLQKKTLFAQVEKEFLIGRAYFPTSVATKLDALAKECKELSKWFLILETTYERKAELDDGIIDSIKQSISTVLDQTGVIFDLEKLLRGNA